MVKPELSFHAGESSGQGSLQCLGSSLLSPLLFSPTIREGSAAQTSSQLWEKLWSGQVYHGNFSGKVKRRRSRRCLSIELFLQLPFPMGASTTRVLQRTEVSVGTVFL